MDHRPLPAGTVWLGIGVFGVEFCLLGPVEARQNGSVVSVGGAKQRALLALLLLHANEVVSRDRLIDELWGATPAPGADHRLAAQVSRLRKSLQLDGRLVSGGGGYALEVDPELIDSCRFERLLEQGRREAAAGETSEAARTLREALLLWRGGALADVAYEPFARAEIERLEELRAAALEERIDADLALGRHQEVVAEVEALTAKHPLRERLRGQQMLALYRCGRQAEALGAYQEFRRALSEELGLEPGQGLRQLELEILNRDPTLELQGSNASPGPAGVSDTAPASAPRTSKRRRVRLAVGGVALLLAALVGGIVASSGGGAATARQIPGDAVGAIGASGGIRAVVPLGTSPSALAAGYGGVWVANDNAGTVSRINPVTRAVVQTLEVGSTPTGIAAGAGDVWVTDNYGAKLFRIDPNADRVVQSIAVGNAPAGVAVGDGSVWVANSSDGTLSRIDATTGNVTGTIGLGGSPTGVAVGLGGVWVSDEADGRVVRVDPQSNQVTGSMSVGTGPTAVAVGFGSVWVANSLDGTVSRIDPATQAVRETVEVGNGAGSLAVGAGGVWVANQYAGTVSRIDPATNTVTRVIRVGNDPHGLALAHGLLWAGSQPGPSRHRGGTLTIVTAISFATITLDPAFPGQGGTLSLTNDGLTGYQHVGGSGSVQLVPDLAVSLPSPTDGGTTYTFHLRRGIRYSNGELVRPQDFRRALQRDLVVGPNLGSAGPLADVVGGAACAAHPHHCDLSKGVVVDDAANTVTFHLVAPDPEFLAQLTLTQAFAVPAGTPMHNIWHHALPATGPYMWSTITQSKAVMVRNPYFHEWSHAAQPDGNPDQIVFRHVSSGAVELKAVESGAADVDNDGPPSVASINQLLARFPSQMHIHPTVATDALILNTHKAPFNDLRIRQAINYAIDRAELIRLESPWNHVTCQILSPYLPGYQRYCPYTLDPNPAGVWHAPNVAKAKRLIAASHTRGTRITIWNLGNTQAQGDTVGPYIVSLLDRLGYRARVEELSNNPTAPTRFADSRTSAQAAMIPMGPQYLSASQMIQAPFACQSFVPNSTQNTNLAEFCDPHLDAQIHAALTAETNNPARAPALWAQADRTLTNQAPFVALDTPPEGDFLSARVGNYQFNFQQGLLWDQLWVR